MPVYPELRLVFVHIPKTAGGAIQQVLAPYAVQDAKTPLRRLMKHLPIKSDISKAYIPVHSTARHHRRVMGRDLWKSFTSFAVVRNPYDRAISAYEYQRQTPSHHRYKSLQNVSFEDWLKERARPQFRYVADRSGQIIVDQVIKYEELHQNLDALFEEVGIPERLPRAGTRNTSAKKPKDFYLTPSAIDIINRQSADDFARLGYDMI